MMMVVAGIASALAGPISIRAASRFNSDKFKQILDFTSFQKKYLIFIFTSTATIIAIPESVLTSWVGSDLGKEIYQIKAALALGHFLRQITAPYGMMLTGLRLEKMIWKSPFIEATTSVICGYILGIYFGVQGVAFGFTIAATFRLTLTLIHDLNITSNHLRLTAMHLIFPWLVK
jgi:O-antigen/teichoic acid export membrane protein